MMINHHYHNKNFTCFDFILFLFNFCISWGLTLPLPTYKENFFQNLYNNNKHMFAKATKTFKINNKPIKEGNWEAITK